jgi:hypothetical protein
MHHRRCIRTSEHNLDLSVTAKPDAPKPLCRSMLSPPTALYIPFDARCAYLSTSRMCPASCASGMYLRVWGWDPRHGSGASVRDVRPFFRPARAQNRLGQVPKPPRGLQNQKSQSLAGGRWCPRWPTSLWHSSRGLAFEIHFVPG